MILLIFEAIIIGLYSLFIGFFIDIINLQIPLYIKLFIIGYIKHILAYYLNLHTYYCNNGYACKSNLSFVTDKRSIISNLDIFTESFFEGIVFIFIGRFIHTFLVTYLKINNQFLLFFLIGFTLHMLSEILHIHTFFCNNRCT